MSFFKINFLLIFCLIVSSCAGGSGSSGVGAGKSKRKATQITKESVLDQLSFNKKIQIRDEEKVNSIYDSLKNGLLVNVASDDLKKIQENLKELAKYKIKDPSIDNYKKALHLVSVTENTLKYHSNEEIKQKAIKTSITEKYNRVVQQLADEKVKFVDAKGALKNLAQLKNTEPHGKTSKLDSAIKSDNYLNMVRYLKLLKLVGKEEEGIINNYKLTDKNVNLAEQNKKELDDKIKKVDKILKDIEKKKNDAKTKNTDAKQALNTAKDAFIIFINNDLKTKIEDQAKDDPSLQKSITLSDVKLFDESGNVILEYNYLDKGKNEKHGKVVAIKVKKLTTSDNRFFKFSAVDFKKNKDNAIYASKNDKVIEVEYKKDSDGKYIFEFENGYSSVTGETGKAKLDSRYYLLLLGNSVNLSYSDFGYLEEIAIAKNNNGDEIRKFDKFKTIVGGYKDKKIDMSKINIDKDVTYTGKIVGFVSNRTNKEEITGDLSLTLKQDKKEDVGIIFKDYYNMKFTSHAISGGVDSIDVVDKRNGDKYKDYTINNSGNGEFKKSYYGDKTNQIGTEASGRFNYNQGNVKINTAFGVKM